MPNIKHRLKHNLFVLYSKGKGKKHYEDPEHMFIHSTTALNLYLKHVNLYADWLAAQGVSTRCSEAYAASRIQDYIDFMVEEGKSPYTIHVALAASCKALGRHMEDYHKPKRTTPPKKGRKPRASAPTEDHPLYGRSIRFAKVVGIRRAEYKDLKGSDFEVIDGVGYVIVRRGKGGKFHRQRIREEDTAFVASYFEDVGQKEKIFRPQELSSSINYHAYRRSLAQKVYYEVLDQMKSDPTAREYFCQEVKKAFRRSGENVRDNPDMQKINKPYRTRGAVRERLQTLGKPTEYDRLALMYVSVFFLSHWRASVCVKYYMA